MTYSNSNRFPYLTATVIDQSFLDVCQDVLTNQLEMVVDIDAPGGDTIYASDRNKYVGGTFYEALTNFPVIRRTVGEWLASTLEFSTLELQLSNVDGRFNKYLPGGANHGTWIGGNVEVKLGLRDVASTYISIFRGRITPESGFSRDVRSIKLLVRDNRESVNIQFPPTSFIRDDFPDIEDDVNGKGAPVVYGSWHVGVNPRGASVPATLVNGRDPYVHFQDQTVAIVSGSPTTFFAVRHRFENDDAIQLQTDGSLPSPFGDGVTYYVVGATEHAFYLANSPGGAAISGSDPQSGTHRVVPDPAAAHKNLQLWISSHPIQSLDTAQIYLFRGSSWTAIPQSEIANVDPGNHHFELLQNTATLWIDGGPYLYAKGDLFYVKCVGYDLGAYTDNPVEIARHLLKTYGGLTDPDFDPNWLAYRDKAAPAESAVSLIKARHWQQESASVIEVALSLLEQAGLEAFVSRDLLWKISSLHFDDFTALGDFTLKNWDITDAFSPSIDSRQPNFNVAKGLYNRLPDLGEVAYETATYKNQLAIDAAGKRIAKGLVFPNLYELETVETRVKENLKLASAYFETIDLECTWRALILDIGDWIRVDVKIQSTEYSNVPALIRDIGYDPNGLKMVMRIWSMQMVPFDGWEPGYSGITGGTTAIIEQEN